MGPGTEGLTRRIDARVDCEIAPETLEKLARLLTLRKATVPGVLPPKKTTTRAARKTPSTRGRTPNKSYTPWETPRPVDVYIVQARNSGLVKIGKAVDVTKRLGDLRAMGTEPLDLLVVLPGFGGEWERRLHRRFAEYRDHGEWFTPGSRLMEYVASVKRRIDEYNGMHDPA
jgi:hypothetical protein